jgi:hypothetical protein
MKQDRSVRQSQTVLPFGPGNIMDLLGESFVACDTSYWTADAVRIDEPRLARALGVRYFKAAPETRSRFGSGGGGSVPYFRFPEWLFCPSCRKLQRIAPAGDPEELEQEPRCGKCEKRSKLVPVRFVCACENGHLGDVPWVEWAHSQPEGPDQRQCQSSHLLLKSVGAGGAGLDSIVVQCATCEARRSLQGITRKDSLRGVGRGASTCCGRQPWQPRSAAEDCPQTPQVLQRGASNLYFGQLVAAIDIPPYSDFEIYSGISRKIASHPLFQYLVTQSGSPLEENLRAAIAGELKVSVDEVIRVVRAQKDKISGTVESVESDIKGAEWSALLLPATQQDMRNRFVTRQSALVDSKQPPRETSLQLLSQLIDRVVIVSRLREVRALQGFTRIQPDARRVPPGGSEITDWLPAIEVYGEGIFITLKEQPLQDWEDTDQIRAAASELESRRLKSHLRRRLEPATPRFLLLHSFAHALIRQLTFECGYSAASIRERLYSREPERGKECAGVLIYTAAGDSEGTLGGLARQGEYPRLAHTILAALDRASWCSLDPICREGHAQGFDGLNRAACHACALLPETSCEFMNALLARDMLVGDKALGEVPGFFAPVVAAVRQDLSGPF